ncbi:MAG TPA: SRPBCC family protein [Solirubrobacteraceae bacterium]|nr:SRPBCC family protein [Solirubrobacteraceae bacterium]
MAIDFVNEITIQRPPAEVFAFVTDPQRLPEWQPLVVEVEVLGGGPLREGSVVREVRRLRGRRLEQTVEVAAYDPPRRFAMKILDGPVPVDGDLTFSEAGGGGTRVRLHAHGSAPRRLRLLEPLLKPVMAREMRKQYARLKAVLEA